MHIFERSAPPELRARLAATMHERRASLVGDLNTALAPALEALLKDEPPEALASLVVDLLIRTVETGQLDSRAGGVVDLQRFCPTLIAPRYMFDAVYHAERVALDELALDPRLGATSEPWAFVAQVVRLAALELLVAFVERLIAVPAHGAARDPLTTLIARPVFELAFANELNRAHRHQHAVSLILFDIDNLSAINREVGYGAGDRVLERVGILARRFFRQYDWVARHDEDSLVALLPETTLDDAAALAHRFRRTTRQRLVLRDHKTDATIPVTLSAAVVGTDRLLSDFGPADMLREAEGALLRARLNGPNRMERVALQPVSVTLLGAAHLLDCSTTTVRRLLRDGKLSAWKRGRHYHIDRASIDRFRAEHSGAHS